VKSAVAFLASAPSGGLRRMVGAGLLGLVCLGGTALASEPAAPSAASVAESSDAAAVQTVIDAVEARYAAVDTIQADFTQVKTDDFGEVRQDGDVVVARPTKMRWRFTTGDEQVFATDGETLTIYTKADGYYQQMPDSTSGSDTAQGFLTSLDRLDEVFQVTLVEGAVGEGGGPTLRLVPHKSGAIASIVLDLDASLVVEQMVMTDSYGNVTDLTFRGMVFDQPVDDSIFKFDKPGAATDR